MFGIDNNYTMKKLFTIILLALFEISANGQIINTIAGNGTNGFSGDGGVAYAAELNYPSNAVLDASGNIFIADQSNNRIRKVSTSIITTIAGNGIYGYTGDGGAATSSELYNPQGLALDASGNIFIADTYNNRLRKVTVSTGIITTVAGNGTQGSIGDGGAATAAELSLPMGVALDASGNIFIVDQGSNKIRKVTVSTGIITTVAGNGTQGYSGDGGAATSAQLQFPKSVALDASGNIFIADGGNNRIRKVTVSTGIITTVAGNGTQGFSGDGGVATAAELHSPSGVALDASGNIFIADQFNNRIRKVMVSTGIITTVAGDGTLGFSGDGGAATSAQLQFPQSIAVDASGNIIIADVNNNRIRIVNAAVGIEKFAISNEQINIYPNPTTGKFIFETNATEKQTMQMFDINGRLVLSQSISGTTNIDVSNFDNGIYTLTIKNSLGVTNKKLVIAK
jgi:sugar lactone lactonase YvrE